MISRDAPRCQFPINPRCVGEPYILPNTSRQNLINLAILENPSAAGYYPLREIFAGINVTQYPQTNPHLLAKIREYARINPSAPIDIILTAGSDAGIKLICDALISPQTRVILPTPTYPHAELFFEQSGCLSIDRREIRSTSEFTKKICATNAIRGNSLIYIVNPNMPFGYLVPSAEITALAVAHPESIFVCDEAYIEFTKKEDSCISDEMPANLLVLRTFSKLFGLAALRIGYIIAHRDTAKYLRKMHNEKSVSPFAMEAALFALNDSPHWKPQIYAAMKAQYLAESAHIAEVLPKICFSNAEIFAFNIQNGNFYLLFCRNPANVCARFAKMGVLIRDKSRDIANCVRICIQSREINDRVLNIIRAINLPCILRAARAIGIDLDGTLRADAQSAISEEAQRFIDAFHPTIITNNSTKSALTLLRSIHCEFLTPLNFIRDYIAQHEIHSIYCIAAEGDDYRKEIINTLGCDVDFDGESNTSYDAVIMVSNFWFDLARTVKLAKIFARNQIPLIVADSSAICTIDACGDLIDESHAIMPDMATIARNFAPPIAKEIIFCCKPDFYPTEKIHIAIGDNAATDLPAHCGIRILLRKSAEIDKDLPIFNFAENRFEISSLSALIPHS
ncbi:MAG: aminotransferase class I/II-fold pyridoxal phosphate-dependent enzyme [Methylomonas sp.]|jgi:histidinol-phosphate aminotransferase|uniref:aminotransferase class I/II-fold pyridoxal phosphate-dependent enzyme n=1 Tax=Methylomonas sp. TaxID=418 RepID=UPI0025FD0962|nr:aminotransferase class I/II-fold pyridoxal phosphate-dependent enzyme [Methylomonas sp.]MCK9608525.1 aminotransferase class I/II-fold pyridoxal phosphate-dependent enzyme [Methylomonas sp.]